MSGADATARATSGATTAPRPVGASRADAAYARLKRDILDNRLSPGFQATEPEIAARLGMSRTPVREALVRLAAEGLVALTPRRGARVLPVSPEDMREIYQLLGALEPDAAADVAAAGLETDDAARLRDAVERMRAALALEDLDAWAAADDDFHAAVLALSPNRRRAAIIGALLEQAHRARMVTLRLRARPERSTAEHAEILTAMTRGDADATRTLFAAHRARAARELIAVLEAARLAGV